MKLFLTSGMLLLTFAINAQFKANYEESKIPEYRLPEALTMLDGSEVKNSEMWQTQRRPEILRLFMEEVYGKIPGELKISSYEVLESSSRALDGKSVRKQVLLRFEKEDKKLEINVLIYLPKDVENAPLFMGLNFSGNHTIVEDEKVFITKSWVRNNEKLGIHDNKATGQNRGNGSKRWPLESIIEAGYGLATIYYGDIDPDKNDFSDGVHPFFYSGNQTQPADNEWGSISAWAWGLSRAMDYFEMDEDIDHSRIILMGHSRLGKTSLWAGAMDERFSIVISNNSGCGGAAISRRAIGETVKRMNDKFPHWCCKNYHAYNERVNELPIDQHLLISLMAPRPVYIASAEDDRWADPRGEFLSGLNASPVYNLFGKTGISISEMPELNQPHQNTIGYHIRTGKHDVTDFDWEQYIKFTDKHLKKHD